MAELQIGLISDIHGYHQKVGLVAEEIKKLGIEDIMVLGDINSRNRNDRESILRSLFKLAKLDADVHVIPGSHETKTEYIATLDALTEQYNNVYDMSRDTRQDIINGFEFVYFPGSDWIISDIAPGEDNYRIHIKDYLKLNKDLKNSDATLLSHIPPHRLGDLAVFGEVTEPFEIHNHKYEKGSRMPGPLARQILAQGKPVELKSKHVGCPELENVILAKKVKRAVFGHIHEAGPQGYKLDGSKTDPNVWSEELAYNLGALELGNWGIVDFKTDNGKVLAKYQPRKIA